MSLKLLGSGFAGLSGSEEVPVWWDAGGVEPDRKPQYRWGEGPTGIHSGPHIRTVDVDGGLDTATDSIHGPQGGTVYSVNASAEQTAERASGKGGGIVLALGVLATIGWAASKSR